MVSDEESVWRREILPTISLSSTLGGWMALTPLPGGMVAAGSPIYEFVRNGKLELSLHDRRRMSGQVRSAAVDAAIAQLYADCLCAGWLSLSRKQVSIGCLSS